MKKQEIEINVDLVVAGGGLPGICTAIQSARMGLRTALINNRPYFGGNSSAELMINIMGASGMQEFNYNARETGIIEELFLENMYYNPQHNRYIWDGILLDKLQAEENLLLFPNTCVDAVHMKEDGDIYALSGLQTTTEKRYVFRAPLFVDDTGDGVVGFLAGAEYRYGREAKSEFGEKFAPEEADDGVLPSTMVFLAHDTGHPVSYKPPRFAKDYTKTDVLEHRIIPPDNFWHFQWYYELDGRMNQMDEYEEILHHHRELVYGVWDYIKNSGKFEADNYEFCYVSPIAGKRESRRLIGDYILTEGDVTSQKDFKDTIGHGGWSIDLHALDGFYSKEIINRHIFLKGIYQIPYRCCYSKDVKNLFIEGRCMSLSHIALGTVRTMATLSTAGQANAVAAFLCKKYSVLPKQVGEKHLDELQQLLMKADQYIIGKKYSDSSNLAEMAEVLVSSVKKLDNHITDRFQKLTNNMALSIPLNGKVYGVNFYGKATQDTILHYRIYSADKPENYNPKTELYYGVIPVAQSETMEKLVLPIGQELAMGHYFIELEANPVVELAMSEYSYTGAVTSIKEPNHDPAHVDYATGFVKEFDWVATQGCLCFDADCEQEAFGAENVTNGYTRPYQLSNIWHSGGDVNQWIKLRWNKKQTISTIKIFFDSNLNRYCKASDKDNKDLFYRMVKDYVIYYKDENGNRCLLCEVENNFQRVNELSFEPINTDEIYMELKKTHGQPFYSVYEIRCY